MKQLLISVAIVAAFSGSLRAQMVNKIPLSGLRADYIEIRAEYSGYRETAIELEYGQSNKKYNDTYVRDETGKKMEFNSALDFVNKMKNYGYELLQVYIDGTKKNYVMKRK